MVLTPQKITSNHIIIFAKLRVLRSAACKVDRVAYTYLISVCPVAFVFTAKMLNLHIRVQFAFVSAWSHPSASNIDFRLRACNFCQLILFVVCRKNVQKTFATEGF